MNRPKTALILAALSLLVLPLAGGQAQAAPAAFTCATTAVVTMLTNGSPNPRPLTGDSGGTDTTSALVVFFCAGSVSGVQVGGSAQSSNPPHCLNSFPGVPAAHTGGGASDEVAWLPFCASPIGVTHIGPDPNGFSLTAGPTCSWITNGHAWFTVASLDLNSITCNNGFAGSGHSYSAAALVFLGVATPGPDVNCNSSGGLPVDVCFPLALSQGQIVATGTI